MATSSNRLLAIVFGAGYLVLGVVGIVVASGSGFFSPQGGQLLGILQSNTFLGITHTVIGAALLIAGISHRLAAQRVNSVVGAVYLVLGLVGLFLVGSSLNVLALNVADNVLHFGSAAVLLAVGLGADKDIGPASAQPLH
jgi:hypothetical protein